MSIGRKIFPIEGHPNLVTGLFIDLNLFGKSPAFNEFDL